MRKDALLSIIFPAFVCSAFPRDELRQHGLLVTVHTVLFVPPALSYTDGLTEAKLSIVAVRFGFDRKLSKLAMQHHKRYSIYKPAMLFSPVFPT